MIRYLLLVMVFCVEMFVFAGKSSDKKVVYDLLDDPIDVILVTHPKDKSTLDFCIDGLRENCENLGRIIVVSSEKLTDKAEWFDEGLYPFSKKDIAYYIGRKDFDRADKFFSKSVQPVGWYFQQLLKLYAPFVIPNISSNLLVVDSDTVFMRPVKFLNENYGGFFAWSKKKAKSKYLNHAARMIPSYKRVFPEIYSVCHHMLFQRDILKQMFKEVEKHHKTSFWKAFCLCVDLVKEGASEYEMYFNYAFRTTNQVELRNLKWKNSPYPEKMDMFRKEGWDFVSFHTYMRKNSKKNAVETLLLCN